MASARPSTRSTSEIRVRRARPEDEDAVVDLLYESATGMYDLYAGTAARAMRVLRAAYRASGNSASREIVTVAEVAGRPAAAMAAFPAAAIERRGHPLLTKNAAPPAPGGPPPRPGRSEGGPPLFRESPPPRPPRGRGPGAGRFSGPGGGPPPPPPIDSFYVDALATGEPFRRRGAARALLEAAEEQARATGTPRLSLETALRNEPAQALYEGFGFVRFEERRPSHGLPGFVGYVKDL